MKLILHCVLLVSNAQYKREYLQHLKLKIKTYHCINKCYKCNDIKCYTHNCYVKSKTFEQFHNEHLDIRYLSGYVSGTMIKETVTIGDNNIQIKH